MIKKKGIPISMRRQPKPVSPTSAAVFGAPQDINFTTNVPLPASGSAVLRKGKPMAISATTKMSVKKNPVSRGLGIKMGGPVGKLTNKKSGSISATSKIDSDVKQNGMAKRSAKVPASMVKKSDKGASVKGASSVKSPQKMAIRNNAMAKRSALTGLGTNGGGLGAKGRKINR